MAHTTIASPAEGGPLPVNIVRASFAHVVLYLVLNMWPAFLGLPVLLFLILSKRVSRHGTFINLCVTFIITGIVSSLLVYVNRVTGPEPAPIFCLFQASTIYGTPPLTSSAAFMLVVQMFIKIRAAHYGQPCNDEDHILRLWAMIIFPYIAFFVAVLSTAIVGANDPVKVSRNRRVFYCSLESDPLTNSIMVACALILFATVVLEVWSLVLLLKHRKVARLQGSSLRRMVDFSFSLRILTFGLYLILVGSLSLVSITSPSSPFPDLVVASAPTVVIVIFGTQADVLHALCFWKKTPPLVAVEPAFKQVDLKLAFDDHFSRSSSSTGSSAPLGIEVSMNKQTTTLYR